MHLCMNTGNMYGLTAQGGNHIISLSSIQSSSTDFWAHVRWWKAPKCLCVSLFTFVERYELINLATADEKCGTCHCYTIPCLPQTKTGEPLQSKFWSDHSEFLTPHLSPVSVAALSWNHALWEANAEMHALDHAQCNLQYWSAGQGLMGPTRCHTTDSLSELIIEMHK